MEKTLYVVSTPIGNLGDISSRAIQTLEECDLILCEDTRVSLKLLEHFGIKKPLKKYEKFSEIEVSNNAENLFESRNKIALISDAGTPCICDPGVFLIQKARSLGIKVVGVPGSSALVYIMSVCGFDVDNFCFLGFLPRQDSAQKKLFQSFSGNSENVNCFVFYESPNRIKNTLENLKSIKTNSVCAINDATKLFEKHYIGNIDDVIMQLDENKNANKGEYVVAFTIPKEEKNKEKELCLEALLTNEMVNKNISLKEAIKNLSTSFSRNDLYKASLNLKNLFN